jgi:hypothetical protein
MVVKRNWKVISGSMAAGAILIPTAAMAQDGIPSLQDIQPYVSESPTSEDAAFYQQIGDGVPVLFDFQSALTADETVLTVASEPSVPSEPTVASEPSAPSEPTVASVSVPSEPSAPSEPSVPSEPSSDSI